MSKKRIAKVALHLRNKSVKEGITYVRAIVKAMTGNTNFPAPDPALSLITLAINDVEQADVAAHSRTVGLATAKQEKYAFLIELLKKLARYVESIANSTPDQAESIIQSAGMFVSKVGIRPPRVLSAKSTAKGEVTLTTITMRNHNYRWEMAIGDSTDEANWKLLIEVRQSKVIKRGLTSGTSCHFRVWPIGKNGIGEVSQVVSTVIL